MSQNMDCSPSVRTAASQQPTPRKETRILPPPRLTSSLTIRTVAPPSTPKAAVVPTRKCTTILPPKHPWSGTATRTIAPSAAPAATPRSYSPILPPPRRLFHSASRSATAVGGQRNSLKATSPLSSQSSQSSWPSEPQPSPLSPEASPRSSPVASSLSTAATTPEASAPLEHDRSDVNDEDVKSPPRKKKCVRPAVSKEADEDSDGSVYEGEDAPAEDGRSPRRSLRFTDQPNYLIPAENLDIGMTPGPTPEEAISETIEVAGLIVYDNSDDSGDKQDWLVDRIVGWQYDPTSGVSEYQVVWAGEEPSASWVDEEDCVNCAEHVIDYHLEIHRASDPYTLQRQRSIDRLLNLQEREDERQAINAQVVVSNDGSHQMTQHLAPVVTHQLLNAQHQHARRSVSLVPGFRPEPDMEPDIQPIEVERIRVSRDVSPDREPSPKPISSPNEEPSPKPDPSPKREPSLKRERSPEPDEDHHHSSPPRQLPRTSTHPAVRTESAPPPGLQDRSVHPGEIRGAVFLRGERLDAEQKVARLKMLRQKAEAEEREAEEHIRQLAERKAEIERELQVARYGVEASIARPTLERPAPQRPPRILQPKRPPPGSSADAMLEWEMERKEWEAMNRPVFRFGQRVPQYIPVTDGETVINIDRNDLTDRRGW